jgi:hypothetical protein
MADPTQLPGVGASDPYSIMGLNPDASGVPLNPAMAAQGASNVGQWLKQKYGITPQDPAAPAAAAAAQDAAAQQAAAQQQAQQPPQPAPYIPQDHQKELRDLGVVAPPPPSSLAGNAAGVQAMADASAPPALPGTGQDMSAAPAAPAAPPPAASNPPPSQDQSAAPQTAPLGQAAAIPMLVDQYADKHGIPKKVARAIIEQESQYGATSPNLGQITSSTAQSPGFDMQPISAADINDPNKNLDFTFDLLKRKAQAAGLDMNNPADLPAILKLQNGGGDPKYVDHVMARMNGGPQYADAGNIATDATPAPAQAPTQLPGTGSSPFDGVDYKTLLQGRLPGQAPDDMMNLSGRQRAQLALAAGFLGQDGGTRGAGQGIMNMLGVQNQDQEQQLKTAQLGGQLASDATRWQQMQAQMALLKPKQDLLTANADAAQTKAANAQRAADDTHARVQIQQGRLGLQDMQYQLRKQVADANISGDSKANAALQLDNVKEAQGIEDMGENAIKTLPVVADMKAAIANGATPGNDMISKWKRSVAQALGVPVGDTDPSSVQLAQAASAQLQRGNIQGMRGLGLRSNREFTTFIAGLANVDQNPQALGTVLDLQERGMQLDKSIYDQWHSMSPDERLARIRTPMGIDSWKNPILQQYGADNGVQPNGAPTQPNIQKGPNGWQVAPPAVQGGAPVKFQIVP